MTSAAPRRRLPEAILRRLSSAPAGRTKTRRLRGLARGHVVMLIVDDQGQVSIRRGPGRIDILEHIVDEVGRRFGHLFQEEKAPLTEEERRQLNAGGVALRAPRRDMAVEGAGRYAEILSTSLSVPEVAKILGVNTSRVRQRLIARTLYGIKTGGEWRVPSFHFHGGREVPGLRAVLPRLSPDMHPVSLEQWLNLPSADLENLSPLRWLLGGRPASVLAEWADHPALP